MVRRYTYVSDVKEKISIREKFDETSRLKSSISFKKMKRKPQTEKKDSQYINKRKDLCLEHIKNIYNKIKQPNNKKDK